MPQGNTKLELLAPARNAGIAREAILHGADAVYMGGPAYGARAAATNPIEDIADAARFAHVFGARLYVTFNTLIYENELAEAQKLVWQLYEAGVDALIVQDMSLLRMDLPPIDLHASTQCDIRTPEKAAFLAACGFSQLVLPREFSIDMVHRVRDAVPPDVALEAFVHGALCVSYSGDCQAGFCATGRSANRGECPQMCRLPYTLIDGASNIIEKDRHLLSLLDLNRIDRLKEMADAGISSFKIEGRLKDVAYVKNTVAAYNVALNRLVVNSGGRYSRASYGQVDLSFTPDLDKTFNRGYTRYFTDGSPSNGERMTNPHTPKFTGQRIGTVIKATPTSINAKLEKELANGDGLGYYNADGEYTGFRLNRVQGSTLFPAPRAEGRDFWRDLKPGTVLYRNNDSVFTALLAKPSATRKIPVDMTLGIAGNTLELEITAPNGVKACISEGIEPQCANSPQDETRKKALSKLGDTVFSLQSYQDKTDPTLFVKASTLSEMRRRVCAALEAAILENHPFKKRIAEDLNAKWPNDKPLDYHDNVANSKAERFYADHAARVAGKALEATDKKACEGTCVMTTRFCLRRELGACLLTHSGRKLPADLYLNSGPNRYRLSFHCSPPEGKPCFMQLHIANPIKH